MDPGPELDMAVAEQVMGWKTPHLHEGELMSLPPVATKNESYQPAPLYSTSLETAWEVVEALREQGYSLDISAYPKGRKWLKPPYKGARAKEWELIPETTHFYQCTITMLQEQMGCWIVLCDAVGTTPAHAICLAAVEAIRREGLYER